MNPYVWGAVLPVHRVCSDYIYVFDAVLFPATTFSTVTTNIAGGELNSACTCSLACLCMLCAFQRASFLMILCSLFCSHCRSQKQPNWDQRTPCCANERTNDSRCHKVDCSNICRCACCCMAPVMVLRLPLTVRPVYLCDHSSSHLLLHKLHAVTKPPAPVPTAALLKSAPSPAPSVPISAPGAARTGSSAIRLHPWQSSCSVIARDACAVCIQFRALIVYAPTDAGTTAPATIPTAAPTKTATTPAPSSPTSAPNVPASGESMFRFCSPHPTNRTADNAACGYVPASALSMLHAGARSGASLPPKYLAGNATNAKAPVPTSGVDFTTVKPDASQDACICDAP